MDFPLEKNLILLLRYNKIVPVRKPFSIQTVELFVPQRNFFTILQETSFVQKYHSRSFHKGR